MNRKSSAHYQREYRRRLREAGLVKKEIWIHPDNTKRLNRLEKDLRMTQEPLPAAISTRGAPFMTDIKRWTTTSLFHALAEDSLLQTSASVELIDGAEPAIHIVMLEYGDLPLFLTVYGDQIIAEAILWDSTDVTDINAFNDTVLRTHKYFPLSTIGLETLSDGSSYYYMFGALSATSILPNVVFEIETLAQNVIQATEAYTEYLKVKVEALS